MTTKAIDIGLLWHSASSGNLGVGALTVANMAITRQVCAELGLEPNFLIISMRDGMRVYVPESEAKVFVVDTKSLVSPGGCWKVLGAQDCVLDIGGGDSFADIYATRRFISVWATKMIAIWRGVPLLLSPQTIGPFTRTPFKQMATMAMNGAAAVIARDRISLEAIRTLAPKAHRELAVDVAFALPYEDRSAQRGGAKLKVGVNVSGLLFNEATLGANKFGLEVDYADFTRRLMRQLLDRIDVEVHILTHATTDLPWDDDSRVADRIAEEFPGAVRVPDFGSPSEAKSYISSLDFLVAGRMHACIAAFSSGTPMAPIAYSRKFSGLFSLLDYPWMVPVTGMDTDAALAFVFDALERRSELADDEAKGMAKVDDLLETYREELRKLFRSVSA